MSEANVDIVLVEDNPKDAELALHALTQDNVASHVHVARDGQEALDFFFGPGAQDRRRTLKVILLDLKLPKVTGLEVLRRLKGDLHTASIPVVVLTCSNVDSDMAECYDLGVNSYLRKPIDFNEFLETTKIFGRYWLVMNKTPP